MKILKHIAGHIEEYVCAATIFIMTALAFANVVSRYWLHASIAATDEVTTALFVFLSTMGAAMAVRRNSHLGLSALFEIMPKKTQTILSIFSNLLGLLFALFITYTGCLMVANQIKNGALSIALQIPQAIYGSFVPVGMAFVSLRFLQNMVKHIRILIHPEAEVEPELDRGVTIS